MSQTTFNIRYITKGFQAGHIPFLIKRAQDENPLYNPIQFNY